MKRVSKIFMAILMTLTIVPCSAIFSACNCNKGTATASDVKYSTVNYMDSGSIKVVANKYVNGKFDIEFAEIGGYDNTALSLGKNNGIKIEGTYIKENGQYICNPTKQILSDNGDIFEAGAEELKNQPMPIVMTDDYIALYFGNPIIALREGMDENNNLLISPFKIYGLDSLIIINQLLPTASEQEKTNAVIDALGEGISLVYSINSKGITSQYRFIPSNATEIVVTGVDVTKCGLYTADVSFKVPNEETADATDKILKTIKVENIRVADSNFLEDNSPKFPPKLVIGANSSSNVWKLEVVKDTAFADVVKLLRINPKNEGSNTEIQVTDEMVKVRPDLTKVGIQTMTVAHQGMEISIKIDVFDPVATETNHLLSKMYLSKSMGVNSIVEKGTESLSGAIGFYKKGRVSVSRAGDDDNTVNVNFPAKNPVDEKVSIKGYDKNKLGIQELTISYTENGQTISMKTKIIVVDKDNKFVREVVCDPTPTPIKYDKINGFSGDIKICYNTDASLDELIKVTTINGKTICSLKSDDNNTPLDYINIELISVSDNYYAYSISIK
ncbi:MAG: hypothetical protein RR334_01220, partial [Clostridia bacterium]